MRFSLSWSLVIEGQKTYSENRSSGLRQRGQKGQQPIKAKETVKDKKAKLTFPDNTFGQYQVSDELGRGLHMVSVKVLVLFLMLV